MPPFAIYNKASVIVRGSSIPQKPQTPSGTDKAERPASKAFVIDSAVPLLSDKGVEERGRLIDILV